MCRADRGTHGGDALGFDLRLISEEIGVHLVTKKARRPNGLGLLHELLS